MDKKGSHFCFYNLRIDSSIFLKRLLILMRYVKDLRKKGLHL